MLFSPGIALALKSVVPLGIATEPIFYSAFADILLRVSAGKASWATILIVIDGLGLSVFNPENSRLQIDLFALLRASAGLGVTTSLTFKFVLIRRHGAAHFLLAIGFSGLAL